MAFRLKILAAAAALAMASAPALATINVGSNPDLLFVAYDAGGTGQTYVRDLGSLSQIGPNGTTSMTFNAPAGSIFGTQITAPGSQIKWGVFALNNADPTLATIYFTGKASLAGAVADTDVSGAASILTGALGGLTQLDIAANGWIFPNGEYSGPTSITAQANALTLIKNFSFTVPRLGNGVGDNMNMVFVTGDNNNAVTIPGQLAVNNALISTDAGNAKGGYWTLLDASGDVAWVANVAAVPIPAAAFLFGPGLLTMFAAARRRKGR
jgi:hypothetical protein